MPSRPPARTVLPAAPRVARRSLPALVGLLAVAVIAAGMTLVVRDQRQALADGPAPLSGEVGQDSAGLGGPGTANAAGLTAATVRLLPGRRSSTQTLSTTLSYKGNVRRVVVHVPGGLLAPAPLIVALHGRAQGPDAIRKYSRLERLADRAGFIVAFPDGSGGSWNAGGCCKPGSETGADDVAFLDEVLKLVRSRAPVDPARISFTGGSNGAMMALRYACERPNVVASVAVVSGPYVSDCVPSGPTAVLELHGKKDRLVPLEGGRVSSLGVTLPPVSASFDPFRRAGSEVKVQVIPEAGHEWMTRDLNGVDATRAIWEWARDHPLPAP